jgi:hypothetical protein
MSNAVYPSELIRSRTPDGTLYLLVMEKPDNSGIEGFQITIGKAGSPLAAWASAVASLMTLALKKGATLEEILTLLSGITSDGKPRTIDTTARSGPEGVWQALMRYRQRPAVDHDDLDERSVRGASVAPWARQRRKG